MLVMSCATQNPASSVADRSGRFDARCIPVGELGEWEILSDHEVLLWGADTTRAYLLTLTSALPELPDVDTIAVIDLNLDGQVCGGGADAVLTQECDGIPVAIASVRWLNQRRTEELLRELELRTNSALTFAL
jgi:hypothetical protein